MVASDTPKSEPVQAKGNQPMVRAYWPRYRREAWIITILMQLAIVAAVGLAMMLAGIHPSTPGFIIIMSVGILTLALDIVLVNLLLAPLRDLAAALTHISGEPTDTTPPKPKRRPLRARRL